MKSFSMQQFHSKKFSLKESRPWTALFTLSSLYFSNCTFVLRFVEWIFPLKVLSRIRLTDHYHYPTHRIFPWVPNPEGTSLYEATCSPNFPLFFVTSIYARLVDVYLFRGRQKCKKESTCLSCNSSLKSKYLIDVCYF